MATFGDTLCPVGLVGMVYILSRLDSLELMHSRMATTGLKKKPIPLHMLVTIATATAIAIAIAEAIALAEAA